MGGVASQTEIVGGGSLGQHQRSPRGGVQIKLGVPKWGGCQAGGHFR